MKWSEYVVFFLSFIFLVCVFSFVLRKIHVCTRNENDENCIIFAFFLVLNWVFNSRHRPNCSLSVAFFFVCLFCII